MAAGQSYPRTVATAAINGLTQFIGTFYGGAKMVPHVPTCHLIRAYQCVVRNGLQVLAGRANWMARCLDRSYANVIAFHDRRILDRPLFLGAEFTQV